MTLKGSSSKETDFIINEVFLFVLGFLWTWLKLLKFQLFFKCFISFFIEV